MVPLDPRFISSLSFLSSFFFFSTFAQRYESKGDKSRGQLCKLPYSNCAYVLCGLEKFSAERSLKHCGSVHCTDLCMRSSISKIQRKMAEHGGGVKEI